MFWHTPKLLDKLIASPKVKIAEGWRVEVRSLTHNILRGEGHAGTPGWGLGRLTSNSTTHTDLHKPNDKLVSG
jgi:hypothetical protein